MLILGLILLIVGWFTFRPLAYAGAVLLLVGLVLWLASHGSSAGYAYY